MAQCKNLFKWKKYFGVRCTLILPLLLKVVLWWRLYPSYLIHFKTETISLCEKKICCLLFSNISVSSRDIQVFKMCKLAKWWRHSLIQPNFDQIWWKKISHMILLIIVLHNTSSTVLLPWQYTGFQTPPTLNAFLATCEIPFWYLLKVLHMLDPASIYSYRAVFV